MANLQVGDKILVTVNNRLCSQVVLNTQRYTVTSVTGSSSIDSCLIGLIAKIREASGWVTLLRNVYPQNLQVVSVWAQVISPIRYRKVVVNVNQSGNREPDAVTANTAAVLTRFSEQASRAGISNMHIPIAPAEENYIDGELTGALITAMQTLGQAIVAPVTVTNPSAVYQPVVNFSGLTSQANVAGYSVGTTGRVMRRRTVRVGI